MKNIKIIIPVCIIVVIAFIFIFFSYFKKDENIKNVSASLNVNNNNEDYLENFYNSKLKDGFVSLDDALSSLNLTNEEIEKELKSKKFVSYTVSSDIFDEEKNIEGSVSFDVYAITTDNYYYLLDITPLNQTFNDDKININFSTADISSLSNIYADKGNLNANVDASSLNMLYNINDDFSTAVLLNYNDKKTNEGHFEQFTFKINLKDESISYVDPSNVKIGA